MVVRTENVFDEDGQVTDEQAKFVNDLLPSLQRRQIDTRPPDLRQEWRETCLGPQTLTGNNTT
ncbi:hypothetical protein OS189_14950 [Sulfitobacter sp. F26169L]|uniref:hypothetical protein n=1 Tax=Sulfitobacter sp. F26169L TaxID=2996015 RepID=UPI00226090F0|nr:hypothetical protein [Sulfitobacter sp. F26169L]MCX7567643.1 hypothetical protein [Sulfitobacter sp. F26169L]